MKIKQSFFDKILKEFLNYGMDYSTSEDGKRKIIWYFGPFSFQINITEWENYFWKFFEFSRKNDKNLQ
ncbi:MAG: hypothetical protein QXF12_03140 [Candidatus Aenigmatarchaeota archaeon]